MAELIKIVQPNSDIIVETTNFTTSELDNEYTKIKELIKHLEKELSNANLSINNV